MFCIYKLQFTMLSLHRIGREALTQEKPEFIQGDTLFNTMKNNF